jgi:protein SCO1/2
LRGLAAGHYAEDVVSRRTNRFARRSIGVSLLLLLTAANALQGCSRTDASQKHGGSPAPSALTRASFTDQDGRTLKVPDLSGHIVVLHFFFTSCPRVCPLQVKALSDVRRTLSPELRSRVRFVSISVDPDNDTAAALKNFALANGVDQPGWSFVRASAADTRAITTEFEALDPRVSGERASTHTTNVFLFDRGGRLMQRYAGSPIDVGHLAREIEQLDAWSRKQDG